MQRCLDEVERDHGTRGNVFCYLATAPEAFGEIVGHLAWRVLRRKRMTISARDYRSRLDVI
jgi:hypothetical protein